MLNEFWCNLLDDYDWLGLAENESGILFEEIFPSIYVVRDSLKSYEAVNKMNFSYRTILHKLNDSSSFRRQNNA